QQQGGKKESAGRRLSQLCPPYAVPSSNSSLDYPRSDARIVENGFATSGGLNKSAKVGLILEQTPLLQRLPEPLKPPRQKAKLAFFLLAATASLRPDDEIILIWKWYWY